MGFKTCRLVFQNLPMVNRLVFSRPINQPINRDARQHPARRRVVGGVAAWEAQAGWRGATGVQVGGMKQRTTNGMAGEVVGSGPGKRRRITTFMQWDALPWRQMCAALAGETADVTGD